MNSPEITLFISGHASLEEALAAQPRHGRGLQQAWLHAPRTANAAMRLFGLPPATPVAPLRYLGDGGAPAESFWACADPVHFVIRGDGLAIAPMPLALTTEDAEGLRAVLSEVMGGASPSPVCVADRGYIGGDVLIGAEFVPLPTARNRDVKPVLPAGGTGPLWRRRLTEAQMLLHAAPFNAARVARGEPAVNGVWFWGAGRLPTAATPRQGEAAFSRIWSDAPLLCGLARHAGVICAPAPTDIDTWLRQLAPGQHLWSPATDASLSERVIGRVLHALAHDEIARLTIVSDDRELTLAPHDLQGRWRRVWRRVWRHGPARNNGSGLPR